MTTNPKALLVEDEEALAVIIKNSLQTRGFDVILISNGEDAYHSYTLEKPDIIVLDVMLPTVSGLQIANKIRFEDKHTPILFLTARTLPNDVLNGYMAGGNDYLKKPFDMEELVVRLKVLLNQNRLLIATGETESSTSVTIGNYQFDHLSSLLTHLGVSKKLTARENEVLKILYQNRNRLLNRKAFLMQVWGDDDFFSSRSLDVYITKLRRYFKNDPHVQIINHRGFGYKLVC